MSYMKDNSYSTMPFSSETPHGEFYIFMSVKDLIAKCEELKEGTFRCRTIGILQSVSGRFFLTSLDSPVVTLESQIVQVSVAYLKEPPQSTVMPYPVQVFGTLQWKKGPVVFAKVLQSNSSPTEVDVEEEADWFRLVLMEICDTAMPQLGPCVPRRQMYWWSPEIAQLHSACVVARRRYTRQRRRRRRDDALEAELHAAYREANVAYKAAISSAKTRVREEVLEFLDRDPWGTPYRSARGIECDNGNKIEGCN